MTTTLSQFCATTPRSWVMKSTDMFSFFFMSLMSWSICACIVGSSAVVGSSEMSRVGEQDRAMAIMTRCRMPPESSCG